MKSNIDLYEKNNKIHMSMYNFNELLVNTIKDLDYNLNKIEQLCEFHNDFINFVNTMKIYESYKWTNLKLEYKNIKIKINKDKKIIHKITNFLGKLTNYYTQNNIENINLTINDIVCKIDLMLYKFNILQRHHEYVRNKSKYMIKNNTIIKINNINNNKQLLLKIYENYISIKILNVKIKKLKCVKKCLFCEINNIKLN